LMMVNILKTISLLGIIPLFVFICIKWNEGELIIKNENLMQGLALWELSLSVIVLSNINAFFIVKILDYKELALYSIIGMVMIVYDFAIEALFSVYSQKYAEVKKPDSIQLIKVVILITSGLSIFYLVSTQFILQILFAGKYNTSIILIGLFCINNSLNLLYVIPSCFFVGQGRKIELRKMMIINIISIIVRLSLIFIFAEYGLSGFLIASIISQGIRVAGGYYISYKKLFEFIDKVA